MILPRHDLHVLHDGVVEGRGTLRNIEEIRTPQKWDMTFIRNCMRVIGPVSSLFDFATFYIRPSVLHADEALFQTGWFVESLAGQVPVIFIIRCRGNPLTNRPATALVVTSPAVVAIAVSLPATSLGGRFGFVVPLVELFWSLAALVVTCLALVQIVKPAFYRHLARGA